MQEYISTKQLASILGIKPKTARNEILKAVKQGCDGIISIGNRFKIDSQKFIEFKNNELKQEVKQCQGTRTQSEYIKEAMSGGFLIHKEENKIANQLVSRIGQRL